jgi:5-methyltetrahydrofolate--homocysteine methyltransferase
LRLANLDTWMTNRFLSLLAQRPWLLADGATGTNLFDMGLQTGDAPELWNEQRPDRVRALHQGFIDAGADIILANSFGGTCYRLQLHGAQDRVGEINRLAAKLAREVADSADRPVIVAGSMGPTGEILEPLGELKAEQAREAFAEQALALAEGGADVLWIETMSARDELEAALAGAGEAGLPVVCTCSFDTNGRTMMGLAPSELATFCRHAHPRPAGFGSNCGVGAAELVTAIVNMRVTAGAEDILVAKANCGIPEWVDGEIRYNGTPEIMAEYARLVRDAGARIIGGCCGTTPEHLRAMRHALEESEPGEVPAVAAIVATLGPISNGAMDQALGKVTRQESPTRRRAGRRHKERGRS